MHTLQALRKNFNTTLHKKSTAIENLNSS